MSGVIKRLYFECRRRELFHMLDPLQSGFDLNGVSSVSIFPWHPIISNFVEKPRMLSLNC